MYHQQGMDLEDVGQEVMERESCDQALLRNPSEWKANKWYGVTFCVT